ncbi:MAG: hypothetical protein F9K30_01275 [Dechloromonas sp.]|nr:MAG: hypothetical protein F9K30_01275 [Dechloromonas sp.]
MIFFKIPDRLLSSVFGKLSVGRLALLLGGLLVFMIYWPGLAGAFLFDDAPNITANPALGLFDGSLSSLLEAAGNGVSSPLGRSLSMASFALNLYFTGLDPFYFKLVNLLIHCVNGWLVFLLVRFVWIKAGSVRNTCLLPACVAMIWSLHPINLTAVLFVTQRMTSLAALFLLLALNLYLKGRAAEKPKIRWAAIAFSFLICWPVAVMSKETGLLFPLYLLLCEWYVFGLPKGMVFKRISLAALSIGCILVLWMGFHYWDVLSAGYRYREFDLAQRLLTQLRILWFHLAQIFLPLPDLFSLYHDDFPVSFSLFLPLSTVIALIAWVCLIIYSLRFRQRWPWLLFGVAWFLVSHLLESTILPLELVHEHRNYLASLGPLLVLSALVIPPGKASWMAVPRMTALICFIFFCGLVTGLRADQWGDEYRRSMLEVATHPDSARANYQAAIVFMEKASVTGSLGNPMAFQAINFYLERASELDQNAKAPLIGLIYMACQTNSPANPARLAQLMDRLSSARYTPGDLGVYSKLSQLLVESRLCLDDQEVEYLLSAALENPWLDAKARGMILAVGMDYAFAKMKSIPLALDYANRAVSVDPSNVALRINLVRMLQIAGDQEMARKAYGEISRLKIPAVQRSELFEIGRSLGIDVAPRS